MSGQLLVVGLNHHSAPLDLRERFAVPEGELPAYVEELAVAARLREAMLISTCNRVELYAVADDWSQAGEAALRHLAARRGVSRDDLEGKTFLRGGQAAVRHVFRVAASLDSMVVGEPQILGQVKSAFEVARGAGRVGPILERCMAMAFHGAKRARTETELARGAASVPSVAVDLAKSIFGELRGRGVLIVGAGEMAQQAAVHLRAAGVSEIIVVNRSAERGRALAEAVDGHYEEWSRLEEQLRRVDVVVTSTGSPTPVLRRDALRPVMKARRHEPLFLVDIAVPRDVEPAAGKLDHVFLFNVDDLQNIVHDNLRARRAEADEAGVVVDEEVRAFVSWLRLRAVGPLIGELQGRGQDIAKGEVERFLRRAGELPQPQRKALEALAHGIVKKMLHGPVTALRAASSEEGPGGPALAEAAARLFELQPTEAESEPQAAVDPHSKPAVEPS